MSRSRGIALVEALGAVVLGIVLVGLAYTALARLDAIVRERQTTLDRAVARAACIAAAGRDLETLADVAPLRSPVATALAFDPATGILSLDAGASRWHLAGGDLYRNGVLALATASSWRLLVWDDGAGRFVEPIATVSLSRSALPRRVKLVVDGQSLERDLQ